MTAPLRPQLAPYNLLASAFRLCANFTNISTTETAAIKCLSFLIQLTGTAVRYKEGAVQLCQERIIICVCVRLGLSQLFRPLWKKKSCSTGSGIRAWFLPQGYPQGYGTGLALLQRVYVCSSLFIVQILVLQLHANSSDGKVCVPPNAISLLLIAAAWGHGSVCGKGETGCGRRTERG